MHYRHLLNVQSKHAQISKLSLLLSFARRHVGTNFHTAESPLNARFDLLFISSPRGAKQGNVSINPDD